MDLGSLLQLAWTSIANAMPDVLLTVAFALVLKVVKVWNFAQAAMMAISFYAMYTCNVLLELPVGLGIIAGAIAGAAAGVAIEEFGFRHFRRRGADPLTIFIFALIFAQFIMFAVSITFTTNPVFVQPDVGLQVWLIDDVAVTSWDLVAIGSTVAMLVPLWAFLRYTRAGQYMIAVADNAKLAEIYGITPSQSYRLSMAIAGLFVSAAMYLFGRKLLVYPELPLLMLTPVVAATIIGGVGNLFAAAVAALMIDAIAQFSIIVVESRWQQVVVLGIMFCGIILFPRGIYWRRPTKARRTDPGQAPLAVPESGG